MERKNRIHSMVMSFFVITACITMMEGVIGKLFLPDAQLGYDAFLMPSVFGFLSALSGGILYSKKELTMGKMAFRMLLQLLLIEAMVLAANLLWEDLKAFTLPMQISLVVGIAVIYAVVHLVMWLNDCRQAEGFNEQLLKFQEERRSSH